MFRKSLLSITFMLFVPQLAYSVDLLDGRFQVINEFPMPANLTDPLGDLLFSDDGSQVFIVDASESTGSAVWQAPVTRNAAGDVTGFGTFTQLFADEEIDTGLTLGPGTGTFIYRTEDNGITQRFSDGTIEDRVITNYDSTFGGLAFVPAGFTNAGNIVSVSYDEGILYLHPASPDGDGSFTIDDPSLFADFSTSIGQSFIGDVEYVTTGPLAGTMLVAAFVNSSVADLYHFPIDPVTGLPAEGTTPTPVAFVNNGNDSAWGVATDPITGNIWLIEWDGTDSDLFQIGAIPPPVGVPTAGFWSSTVLMILIMLVGIAWMRRVSY